MSDITDEIKKIPTRDYIDTYAAGKSITDECVRAWGKIWELIRRCQLHLQGESPNNYLELKKRGQGWCSNENFLKGTAKHQKLTAESVAEIWKALALGYVSFRDYNEKTDKGTVLEFLNDEGSTAICSMAIGCALVSMLIQENRMVDFLNAVEYPSIAFGFAALLDKDDDWLPEVVHPYNIGFKPKSRLDELNDNGCYIIFQTISAKTLWGYWEKCKNDGKSEENKDGNKRKMASKGWNILALQEVLWRIYNGHSVNGAKAAHEYWADTLVAFNKSHTSVIENSDSLTIAKIYYQELDGTLSVTYIPYQDNRNIGDQWAPRPYQVNQAQGNSVDMILFKKNFGKKKEKLKLIRESGYTETTYIEDYRGLAKFSVKDSIAYNRIRNGLVDKLQIMGSPWFSKGNSQTGESFKLTVSSSFILAPTSYDLLPKQPQFDLQSPLVYLGFQEKEFNRETEHFDADLQLSSRPNKSEVAAQQQRVNDLESNKNVIRIADYSNAFYSIIKKFGEININSLSEVAQKGQKKFFSLMKKHLKAYLKDTKSDDDIKKIIGAIDSYVIEPFVGDTTVLTIAMQMAESPYARNRYKRMILISNGLPLNEVNIAAPLITTKMADYGDARIADFENDLFTISPKQIQFNDDDIVHLDIHIPKGQKIVQAFEQRQIAPDYAYKYLVNLNAHIFLHIQKLGQDPVLNKKAQEYIPIYSELKQQENQIRIVAEKMMEAQAKQAEQVQLTPEVEADIARKNAQALSKEQRQDHLQQNRTAQSYEKIAADERVAMEKVRSDERVKMAQTNIENNGEVVNPSEQVTP